MKATAAPLSDLVGRIMTILLLTSIVVIMVLWATQGTAFSHNLEKATLSYSISSSVTALSTVESGSVERNLLGDYDIEIQCKGQTCSLFITGYIEDKPLEKSKGKELTVTVTPAKLTKVNYIRIDKRPGEPITFSGNYLEEEELIIPHFSSRCMLQEYKDRVKFWSDKRGLDENLVAAVIERESSWDPKAYRYEPKFYLEYIEGKEPYLNSPYYLEPKRISASYGLMQILYTTAFLEGFEGAPEELKDVETNLEWGTYFLKELTTKYRDQKDAISAYNAGEPAWETNPDNRRYTADVIGLYEAYKRCSA